MVTKKHLKITIDCSFGSDFQEGAFMSQLVTFIEGLCQFYKGTHKSNKFKWFVAEFDGETQESKKLKEREK
jgi:hypothetical protein